jgi:ADP-ribosyl-[dinitrogen reductase] hydrolase
MAVDARVFDVGMQTAQALRAIGAGAPVLDAALTHDRGLGNGALMRVLLLSLWHRGPDEDLMGDARLSSRPTQPHLRSQLCCVLYCLWPRSFLQEQPDPWA